MSEIRRLLERVASRGFQPCPCVGHGTQLRNTIALDRLKMSRRVTDPFTKRAQHRSHARAFADCLLTGGTKH